MATIAHGNSSLEAKTAQTKISELSASHSLQENTIADILIEDQLWPPLYMVTVNHEQELPN